MEAVEMKTLVTGASGFISSTIVRKLLKEGADVRVTTIKGSDTKNIDGLDVEKVYSDIRDRDSIRAALKGCETLYTVAAYFAHWSLNTNLFYDINVKGTKNILGDVSDYKPAYDSRDDT
jgi:dihydroflavonol-4-reductase